MEKYEALEMEIVEFDGEDVVTASRGAPGIPLNPKSRWHLSEDTLFSYEWFLNENPDDEEDD